MADKMQFRNDTAANWTSNNPILAVAEPGLEYDTGMFKFGDGITHWNSLAYSGNTGATQTLAYRSYGDGSDGSQTISTQITLASDMHYNNLTLAAGGQIITNGWRIFVKGTLDLRNAIAGAIQNNGGNGASGAAFFGGTGGTAPGANSLGGGSAGGTGGVGGVYGTGANGATSSNVAVNGGTNGASGIGGANGSGISGGTGGAAIGLGNMFPVRRWSTNFLLGATQIASGNGARGAGGGGGDGVSNYGGGGGGGGAGGGIVGIWANTILKGSSTAAYCIQALGGNGGSGGNGGPDGNTGGGGGAGGGGGGWIYIATNNIAGAEAFSALAVDGGAGGSGGTGTGTGFGGNGGGGGTAGLITIFNALTGAGYNFVGPSSTTQYPDSLGTTAASGIVVATGGTGGNALKLSVSL